MNPELLPKVRAESIMQGVKDYPCTLRVASLAGLQCSGSETVVGAHLPVFGKGMGTKVTDLAVAASCSVCHDLIDGRDMRGTTAAALYPKMWMERLIRGLVETHAMLERDGIISVKNSHRIQ